MAYSLFQDDIDDIIDSLSGSRRDRDACVNGPAGIDSLIGSRRDRYTGVNGPAGEIVPLTGTCPDCPGIGLCGRDHCHDPVSTTPQPTKPKDNSMFDSMFNGICGRIKPGNCRLSYTGGVAIRTADGTYKTYNLKTGQLTNCDRFVFDVGDDLFMMIPTRKLKKGDIVLFGGQPKCVIEVLKENKHVKVINYNTAVIEEVVPERHVFMGRRFYGKIVSLMGNGLMKGGKGGMFKNLLKFKMMSSMLGGGGKAEGLGDIGGALPMMFMMGGGSFDGMFDFDEDSDDDSDDDDDDGDFLGKLLEGDDEKADKAEKPETKKEV